ncbi:MAG: Gfo/Idh/MocA family oxidoreductase [Chloroflexi bacterium]|nr:MAG: Gfo/Idh/MocA family oxidoreductase [Chloroflexota bacterium]TME37379.1 MAG: Gfo/Idh/MocA family oxidoreductase [Chloroflexota bacterium]
MAGVKLRVGLISFAHVHAAGVARTLRALDQVDFIGVHDEDAARGRAAAKEHGARWHESLDGLLAASDAVVIESTNADHRRYTEAAAARGVHVLTDKPIATTVADGKAMIDTCARAGVQLGIAFPVRSSPAVIALREAIAGGMLGTIRAVRATNPGQYPGRWFGDKKAAGGGAVMDHTVHAADAIRWLLADEVTRVHAELGSFVYGLDVEDCGILTLDLASGAFASIDCSWSRPQTFPTWGGVTLHVVGDKATVDIDVFRQALTHYDDAAGRAKLVGWGDDLNTRMIGDFVDAILARRRVPIDGEAGLRALEVAIAAYRSAEMRRPVDIAAVRA